MASPWLGFLASGVQSRIPCGKVQRGGLREPKWPVTVLAARSRPRVGGQTHSESKPVSRCDRPRRSKRPFPLSSALLTWNRQELKVPSCQRLQAAAGREDARSGEIPSPPPLRARESPRAAHGLRATLAARTRQTLPRCPRSPIGLTPTSART